MTESTLYTIGFTQKSAEKFFTLLRYAGVKKVIDIRLNNVSQLAGFAKRDDLAYFLRKICDCEYLHQPKLAPTKEILHSFKNKEFGWDHYETLFRKLMLERRIDEIETFDSLDGSCLLCSESSAKMCHRRLVAEFYSEIHPQLQLVHL